MTAIMIRDAKDEDFIRIVELNAFEVQQTSAIDVQRLKALSSLATYLKVAAVDGHVAAFLLAMREKVPYQNDNYSWFAARFSQFIYVDRIVVGSQFSGLRIGSFMYEDLFEYARASGVDAITCEYNVQPPNPASQKFHDKFGFKEIGTQWVANGSKQVSLQVATLSNA